MLNALAIIRDLTEPDLWLPWLGQAGALAALVLFLWIGMASAAWAHLSWPDAARQGATKGNLACAKVLTEARPTGVLPQYLAHNRRYMHLAVGRKFIADNTGQVEMQTRRVSNLVEPNDIPRVFSRPIDARKNNVAAGEVGSRGQAPVAHLSKDGVGLPGKLEQFPFHLNAGGGRSSEILYSGLDLNESAAGLREFKGTDLDLGQGEPRPMFGFKVLPRQLDLSIDKDALNRTDDRENNREKGDYNSRGAFNVLVSIFRRLWWAYGLGGVIGAIYAFVLLRQDGGRKQC